MSSSWDIPNKLDFFLYLWYIKYERLIMMMQEVNAPANEINIYIDLYEMLNKYYKSDFKYDTDNAVTASIINLVAHFRGYFRNKHAVKTRFYLVYGDESNGSHTQYLPSFGKHDYERTIEYEKKRLYLEDQLQLVNMLVDYIPGVYYIRSTTSFDVWSYYRIISHLQKDPHSLHFVLSASKYTFQIPAMLYGYHVYCLKPNKTKTGDESFIVPPSKALTLYYNRLTPTSKVKDLLCDINPRLLSLFMTLNGCRDKKVTAVTNITRTAPLIYNAIKNNRIMNDYQSDMSFVYEALVDFNIHTIIDKANFENRFKGLDMVFQTKIYAASPESKNMSWNKDLHDPETMKDLNVTYFKNVPLDLINL